MIQELLGGGGLMEERKIMPTGLLRVDGSSNSSAATTPPHSVASSPSSSTTSDHHHHQQQNLRCPRCDSSNTKFCYYNNYNLTQPRHFCKTCRRYWTKGGALRNVPIGGGCRKTKIAGVGVTLGGSNSSGAAGKASTKVAVSDATVLGKLNLCGLENGMMMMPSSAGSTQHLWPPVHQTSNLMALLWSAQTNTARNGAGATPPPPLPPVGTNRNHSRVKEEGGVSYLVPDATLLANSMNARALGGLDSDLGRIPLGHCSSLWKNTTGQYQYPQQQQQAQAQPQQNSMQFGGDVHSSGIHEIYQKLRSAYNYNADHKLHSQELWGSLGGDSASSTTATAVTAATTAITTGTTAPPPSILEPSPIAAGGGEFGYWNLPLSWSDMPAANGVFP